MTVDVKVHLPCCDTNFIQMNNPVPDVVAVNKKRNHIIVVSFPVMSGLREDTRINNLYSGEVSLGSFELLQDDSFWWPNV